MSTKINEANADAKMKTADNNGKRMNAPGAAPANVGRIPHVNPVTAAAGYATGKRIAAPTENFIDERDDVLAVITELEDQLDTYEQARTAIERELAGSNEKLQSSTQRISELEWQVVTLQTRLESTDQVRQENALLEEEIADANHRAQQTSEQLSSAEKENGRLAYELKNTNKQIEELWTIRKERDSVRAEIKKLAARAMELEQALRDITEDRVQIQSRLVEAQAAFEDARAARHQLEQATRSGEEKARELQRANEALNEKVDTLRGEKKSLQAQILHLERENGRLSEQRQSYETEMTSLRSMNRTSEAALASMKKAFAEVRIALAETKSRSRRRTIENWPRVGGGLRGITLGSQSATSESYGNSGVGIDESAIGSNEFDFANVAPTPTYGQTAGPTPASV